MNIYSFELTSLCPNGKLADRYDCEVVSEGTIHVERFAEYASSVKTQKRFQEDIADELRNKFQARVVVTGWHFGIKVTCVRE
jgi:NADPH-dependent 7-cyano-7-deazaguanine reductase QueF